MRIRRDYWNWAVEAFGKDGLKELVERHPLGQDIFLSQEEKRYVMKAIAS